MSADQLVLAQASNAANAGLIAALQDVRTYRNLLVAATAGLVIALVGIPVVAANLEPDFVTLSSVPSGTTSRPEWTHYATIELWGALGGLLGMLLALRRLRTTAGPFGLFAVQAIIKVPAGALLALALIVVIQGGAIERLQAVTDGQLAAFAIVFGFAEEAATRFIDRRANEILEHSDPTTAGGAATSP